MPYFPLLIVSQPLIVANQPVLTPFFAALALALLGLSASHPGRAAEFSGVWPQLGSTQPAFPSLLLPVGFRGSTASPQALVWLATEQSPEGLACQARSADWATSLSSHGDGDLPNGQTPEPTDRTQLSWWSAGQKMLVNEKIGASGNQAGFSPCVLWDSEQKRRHVSLSWEVNYCHHKFKKWQDGTVKSLDPDEKYWYWVLDVPAITGAPGPLPLFGAGGGRSARSGACVSVDARAPFPGSAVLELADWDGSDLIAGRVINPVWLPPLLRLSCSRLEPFKL